MHQKKGSNKAFPNYQIFFQTLSSIVKTEAGIQSGFVLNFDLDSVLINTVRGQLILVICGDFANKVYMKKKKKKKH